MRVFKPTYKTNGKTGTSPRWHVAFRDHRDIRRRVVAFTDKAASTELGRKIEKLVALVGAGERPDSELARWIETMPPHVRDKLAEWGVLNERAASASKPLIVHLEDWRESMLAKGNEPKTVDGALAQATRIVDCCGFKYWADLAPSRIEGFLKGLRDDGGKKPGIGRQTSNWYLQAIKQFATWMVQDGRAAESPIAHLKGLNARVDRRRERRALTADELQRLLQAATDGPRRRGAKGGGVSGPERAMLYRVAVETGLRAAELRSLTASSFDLDTDEPTVTVAAAFSKHRREDVQPLRVEVAVALRDHLATKAPDALAFGVPSNTATMVRRDLAAARATWLEEAATDRERAERDRSDFLRYIDSAGRYADFHALRHTFITNLTRAGVHPKTAQSLARHSTITLTMDKYTHTLRDQDRAALDALPRLTPAADEPEALRATGTDDTRACAQLAHEVSDYGREAPGLSIDTPGEGSDNAFSGCQRSSILDHDGVSYGGRKESEGVMK